MVSQSSQAPTQEAPQPDLRLIGAAGDSAPAPASYAQPFAVPGALDEYEARDNSY